MNSHSNIKIKWKIGAGVCAVALAFSSVLAGCTTASTSQDAKESDANTSASATQPAQTSYPLTLTMHDATGATIEQTYDKPPERVVTLIDSAAEIMCRLGLADKVVGTVAPNGPMPDDIAADYAKIPVLGEKAVISRETIVGLSPDLIIGPIRSFSPDKQTDAATYNGLGSKAYIQIASSDQGEPTLQGIIDDVKNIATIFNVQEKAAPLIKQMEDRLHSLEKTVASKKTDTPQNVMLMAHFKEGTFVTFNPKMGATLQYNLIKMMGAEPVSPPAGASLTYENLITLHPDVIVYVSTSIYKNTDSTVIDTLYNEPSIQSVPAIANKRVIELPYAAFMDTSPRVFDSAEKLLDTLYPSK